MEQLIYIGLGVAFIIIILLWRRNSNKNKEIEISTNNDGQNNQPVYNKGDVGEIATEYMNDKELIAVISAAIAAASENISTGSLFIQKIRRVSGETTAWRQAGGNECIASRKFY
jgi:hypothetical protein